MKYGLIRRYRETVNFNFATNDSHSDLHRYMTVSRGYKRHRDGFFLRAESFYNVASNIDELDAPEKIVESLLGEE